MTPARVQRLSVLGLVALLQPAYADTQLMVHAEAASTRILPQERRHARLPNLEFTVRADYDCADEGNAASVSFSVADAHQRLVPQPDQRSVAAVITVPANQIAPIATGDFCNGSGEGGELLLNGVATAQVALFCRDENRSSVRYASLGLPLRLVCDQEPPSDSAR